MSMTFRFSNATFKSRRLAPLGAADSGRSLPFTI
jgi:hypothetical protein